jgi:hypothetical protein
VTSQRAKWRQGCPVLIDLNKHGRGSRTRSLEIGRYQTGVACLHFGLSRIDPSQTPLNEVRRIAANIATLPELLGRNYGLSAARVLA